MPGAIEKGDTDLPLQLAYLVAERRLRYPQRIRSFAEASELRHAIEGFELTEIHLANLGTRVNTL